MDIVEGQVRVFTQEKDCYQAAEDLQKVLDAWAKRWGKPFGRYASTVEVRREAL